jgi:molybdate transport system substrate-binding protein
MIVAFFTSAAHAAEVRVLSAAAMQSVFKDVRDDFQRTTGYKMIIHYGTIGAVNEWTMAGEEADLIIGSSRSMLTLVKARKISARSLTPICRTGIGVVVAKSIELNVKSVEDFTRTLISTKDIFSSHADSAGTAGIHVAKVIAQQKTQAQIRLGAGGDITEVTLGLGPSALGITQISEIADKPKAQLVGPLPEELQNYTVFVAGVPANAPQSGERCTAEVPAQPQSDRRGQGQRDERFWFGRRLGVIS